MIWVILKEIWFFLAQPDKSRLQLKSFASWMLVAYWAVMGFLLYVSIPHSKTIIQHYEPGGDSVATSMAVATELVPALAFLVGMHFQSLGWRLRALLMGLSAPFVALVFLLQLAAFGGVQNHPIDPSWLAAILPYGVIVTAIGIAIVAGHVIQHRDELAGRINAAVEAARAEAETRIKALEQSQQKVEAEKVELTEKLQKWEQWGAGAHAGNQAMQAKIAELETQIDSMQIVFASEREALLDEFETRLAEALKRKEAELRRQFETMQRAAEPAREPLQFQKPVSNRPVEPVQTSAADGGASVPVEAFRERFKTEPSIELLREAYLAGISDSTLKTWVQRYTSMKWSEISAQVKAVPVELS